MYVQNNLFNIYIWIPIRETLERDKKNCWFQYETRVDYILGEEWNS